MLMYKRSMYFTCFPQQELRDTLAKGTFSLDEQLLIEGHCYFFFIFELSMF